MLTWEDRFAFVSGPVRSYREIVDTPQPTPMSTAFVAGHLRDGGAIRDFPKARAFNNQPAKLPKERRKGNPARLPDPIGPCLRPDGHEWKSKGVDRVGTRLVRCPHCKHCTTARNAGVDIPYTKRSSPIPIPIGGEPACANSAGHKWNRDGMKSGVKRIICRWCKARSKEAPHD